MDLAALQEKINNYITVVSSWVRNVGKLYFSGTAEDVTVQMIDDNGNVVDTTLPNVAQFRKTVWDDVGGAIGQMSRTLYVDSVNGDDLNNGSITSPFKTISKACSIVPIGGRGTIFILEDYILNEYIELSEKNITFASHQDKENALLTIQIRPDGGTPIGIDRKGRLFIRIDTRFENNYDTTNRNLIVSGETSSVFFYENNGKSINAGAGVNASLSIGDYCILAYIREGAYRLSKSDIVTDTADLSTIRLLSVGYFCGFAVTSDVNMNGNAITTSDITSTTVGVVKDANGVPRNIVSNIVY